MQVWSSKSTSDLGWSPTVSSISTSYAEPLDTYCDMSQLIPSEAFPPHEVGSIGYFCGPLEDTGNHDGDLAAVKSEALDYFSTEVTKLWPKAVSGSAFDWDVLVDDGNGQLSIYATTVDYDTDSCMERRYRRLGLIDYRLRSNESGYSNLVLAGD